jgi:hypothetical protein
MADIEKIKTKIRKLFELSTSPNANEAAAAVEMAQKLLEEYGLIKDDIPTLDVNEEHAPRGGGGTPPGYEIWLANALDKAFGVRSILSCHLDEETLVYRNTYRFIGIDYRAQVAAYIATVLFRKLNRARTEYIKSLYRVKSRAAKIKRGDEFCRGWVTTVIDKLKVFSVPEEEEMALDMYMQKFSNLETVSGINRGAVKKYAYQDWYRGREAGSGVEIQQGVEGRGNGARLLPGA